MNTNITPKAVTAFPSTDAELQYRGHVARCGHVVLPPVLTPAQVKMLRDAIDALADDDRVLRRDGAVYGIRDVFRVLPIARDLADSPLLRQIVTPVLGSARLVRGLFFDKSPSANWKVIWHQDVTIEVRRCEDTDGFQAWSEKEGVVHVQPPVRILEQMISLRVHLDDTNAANGALKVVPGSHMHGKLSPTQIIEWRQQYVETCSVQAGGVHVLRPLLLHASSQSEVPCHRRVLHFDYCAAELPAPLEWRF